MTNQEKFIQIFGIDVWQQMIVFSGLAEQFKEYWTSPYKAESSEVLCHTNLKENAELVAKILDADAHGEVFIEKIRAEIEQEYNCLNATRVSAKTHYDPDEILEVGECLGLKMSLKIINKYTAEMEDKNGNNTK